MSSTRQILVTLPGGRRVDAQVGTHVLQTDQPLSNGGTDTAPSPFELFLASMGTCAGIFIQGFCAKRGIPFEGIQVVEELTYDDSGALTGVDLDIRFPADFPEKYRDAVVKVADQCSVKRALASPPAITVRSTMSGEEAQAAAH